MAAATAAADIECRLSTSEAGSGLSGRSGDVDSSAVTSDDEGSSLSLVEEEDKLLTPLLLFIDDDPPPAKLSSIEELNEDELLLVGVV